MLAAIKKSPCQGRIHGFKLAILSDICRLLREKSPLYKTSEEFEHIPGHLPTSSFSGVQYLMTNNFKA